MFNRKENDWAEFHSQEVGDSAVLPGSCGWNEQEKRAGAARCSCSTFFGWECSGSTQEVSLTGLGWEQFLQRCRGVWCSCGHSVPGFGRWELREAGEEGQTQRKPNCPWIDTSCLNIFVTTNLLRQRAELSQFPCYLHRSQSPQAPCSSALPIPAATTKSVP